MRWASSLGLPMLLGGAHLPAAADGMVAHPAADTGRRVHPAPAAE